MKNSHEILLYQTYLIPCAINKTLTVICHVSVHITSNLASCLQCLQLADSHSRFDVQHLKCLLCSTTFHKLCHSGILNSSYYQAPQSTACSRRPCLQRQFSESCNKQKQKQCQPLFMIVFLHIYSSFLKPVLNTHTQTTGRTLPHRSSHRSEF